MGQPRERRRQAASASSKTPTATVSSNRQPPGRENLLFANGLLLWKDGSIVTMVCPKSSTSRTANRCTTRSGYRGFAEQNPQLRVSHPIPWVRTAGSPAPSGLRGGKVTQSGGGDKSQWPGRRPLRHGLPLRSRQPDQIRIHDWSRSSMATPSTIGAIGSSATTAITYAPRRHGESLPPAKSAASLPRRLVEDISTLDDGPLFSGGKIYPISKNWTTSSLHEGRFTAACGVFVYHGNLLDANLQQGARRLVPWPPSLAILPASLVHMEILTPKGATFAAKPRQAGGRVFWRPATIGSAPCS